MQGILEYSILQGIFDFSIVQSVLGKSAPKRLPKCIVLNFDLSAESLDHSKLDGRVDVIAWRGNVLDVTKFSVFTKQFVQTYDEYADGHGDLSRVEHAYVTAVTKMPWLSKSAECPVVLLPERERLTKRFKSLKPRKLAIPILSLDRDSLAILAKVIPEEITCVQYVITFHGNVQKFEDLPKFLKEKVTVSIDGSTLGSRVVICKSKKNF